MILYDKVNPLEELAHIVRAANPATAGDITADNIAVDNIKAIDPAVNEGFNTECEVRMIGPGTAVGVVKVRFNRIDLRNYVPSANNSTRVRVGVVTAKNKRADIVQIAPRISKAIGTMLDVTGPHKDYVNTGTYVINKGAVVANFLDFGNDSLRYVPCRWYFHTFGLGVDIDAALTNPSVKPFVFDDGTARYNGDYVPPIKYVPEEGKRSYRMTLGMLDFTSVWGVDPYSVVESNPVPGGKAYRFKPDAFDKINLILSTAGLPPLPANEFSSYGKGGSGAAVSPRYPELNYHFYLNNSWVDYDYKTIANLHPESTNNRDYIIFPCRT